VALYFVSGHRTTGSSFHYLSDISIWELCKLAEKGRVRLNVGVDFWVKEALKMSTLRTVRINAEIAYASTVLPGNFHDDPADQIIVSTARAIGATLLTRDTLIQRYEHVNTLWE
jgi:PIN domain nuclease of toxin-antitoxin system